MKTIICPSCGKSAVKVTGEINRNLRRGRLNYCSKACAARWHQNSKHPSGVTAMHNCDRCGSATLNQEDDYAEFICNSCRDNEAEAAWSRQFEGEPPISDRERCVAAWHEHQKAYRR